MCGLFGQVRDVRRHDLLGIVEPLLDRINKGWGILTVGEGELAVTRNSNYWSSSCLPMSAKGSLAVLGHLRAATGANSDGVVCSHPFNIGPLYMAHNGILITQHPEVRGVNVDSARLLHAIYREYDVGQPLPGAISWVLSRTDGQHACWLYDASEMKLYLWRNMSPLWVEQGIASLRFGSLKFSTASKMLGEGVVYEIDVAKNTPTLEGRIGFTVQKYYEEQHDNQ